MNINNYFGEIGVEADNEGTIASCRVRGFEALESIAGYLELGTVEDVSAGVVVAGCPARIIKQKDERTAGKTAIVDALRRI